MGNRLRWALLGVLAVAFGCGTQPIPGVAVAGTTVTIPVPHHFPAGFGTAFARTIDPGSLPMDAVTDLASVPWLAYDNDSLREDEQRGDLVFSLRRVTDSIFVTYLRTEYITRVHLDPAATVSDESHVRKGQTIAFVEIPVWIPKGDYFMEVARVQRSLTDPYAFEEMAIPQLEGVDWIGWGGPGAPTNGNPDEGIPIRIVEDAPVEEFTRLAGLRGWDQWLGLFVGSLVTYDLERFFPHPKVWMRVFRVDEAPPAAWEMEVEYSVRKMRIRGVFARQHNQTDQLLLTWQTPDEPNSLDLPKDSPQVPCTHTPDPAVLKIQMFAPTGAALEDFDIAFELRNWEDDNCAGRYENGDLSIDLLSVKAFDLAGTELDDVFSIIYSNAIPR